MVGLEQAGGRGRERQRQHGGLLEGKVVGDRRNHVSQKDGVFLEGALGGTVAVAFQAGRHTQDAVAPLQACHVHADLDHLAGHVPADHRWKRQPGQDQPVGVGGDRVDRVDRDGAYPDHDLVGPGHGVGRRPDPEAGSPPGEPEGGVLWHGCLRFGDGTRSHHRNT